MKANNLSVYILALLAMVFWGVSYVWTKIAFEFYQPVTVMFIRLSISSMLIFLILKVQGKTPRIARTDYVPFIILSFFSPFCYFIGENFGLMHVTPTIASVIIATIPVFTPILGFIAFREKLSLFNVAGFLISFTGILVMVLDNSLQFSASPKGLFFLFFAVASALINVVFLKKLVTRYSSFTIIAVQNLLGALFFMPLFLVFELREVLHIRPSAAAIMSLLALAVFGSTLAFMFFTSAVRALGVARTAVFTNLIPVITAITSYLVLREVIDLNKIIGMLIVITGLIMTQVNALRRRKENLQRSAGQTKKPENNAAM